MSHRIRINTVFWGAILGSFCANKLGNEFVVVAGYVPKGDEVGSTQAGLMASLVCYPSGFLISLVLLWWYLLRKRPS